MPWTPPRRCGAWILFDLSGVEWRGRGRGWPTFRRITITNPRSSLPLFPPSKINWTH
jgi:hypothetical protein